MYGVSPNSGFGELIRMAPSSYTNSVVVESARDEFQVVGIKMLTDFIKAYPWVAKLMGENQEN